MKDLYTLFTNPGCQSRIFNQGFRKEYVPVGSRNSLKFKLVVDSGELPAVKGTPNPHKVE